MDSCLDLEGFLHGFQKAAGLFPGFDFLTSPGALLASGKGLSREVGGHLTARGIHEKVFSSDSGKKGISRGKGGKVRVKGVLVDPHIYKELVEAGLADDVERALS